MPTRERSAGVTASDRPCSSAHSRKATFNVSGSAPPRNTSLCRESTGRRSERAVRSFSTANHVTRAAPVSASSSTRRRSTSKPAYPMTTTLLRTQSSTSRCAHPGGKDRTTWSERKMYRPRLTVPCGLSRTASATGVASSHDATRKRAARCGFDQLVDIDGPHAIAFADRRCENHVHGVRLPLPQGSCEPGLERKPAFAQRAHEGLRRQLFRARPGFQW
jgi:hypothetical protein